MADISKVATPITNKNIIAPVKERPSAEGAAVDFQQMTRVLKTGAQSELLQQNTGNIEQERPPSLLLDQMTDPQVTVGYIRSIMLLQEIVGLLPLQNQSFTEEIRQLFSRLQLSPEQLTDEMVRQENASTAFKGELFDFLRNELTRNPQPEMKSAVLRFLKAVNSETSRQDILGALSGSFSYLAKLLSPSKALSQQLSQVAEQFSRGAAQTSSDTAHIPPETAGSAPTNVGLSASNESNAPPGQANPQAGAEVAQSSPSPETGTAQSNPQAGTGPGQKQNVAFSELQHFANQALTNVEHSILHSEKTARLISLARYNLSRYNDNTDFLGTAANQLMELLSDENKPRLLQKLYEFLTQHQLRQQTAEPGKEALPGSQVMNALTEILEKQTESPVLRELKGETMEGIVHSILSSPSNFTPLLHFLLPVLDGETSAMAEMWVNPDEPDTADPTGGDPWIHMLVVFELAPMGQFEAEIYARSKELRLSLLCPASCTELINRMSGNIRQCVNASGYRMQELQIAELARPRSLVDVFPALPQKRTGLNAKI